MASIRSGLCAQHLQRLLRVAEIWFQPEGGAESADGLVAFALFGEHDAAARVRSRVLCRPAAGVGLRIPAIERR